VSGGEWKGEEGRGSCGRTFAERVLCFLHHDVSEERQQESQGLTRARLGDTCDAENQR
jgi:hypothetical protein